MKGLAFQLVMAVFLTTATFVDHPMMDPDYGTEEGLPYHPGRWVWQSLNVD